MGRKSSGRKGPLARRRTLVRSFERERKEGDDRAERDGGKRMERNASEEIRDEAKVVPIDVYSRQARFLADDVSEKCVGKTELRIEEEEEEEEEECIEFKSKTRFVFVASLCVVCSQRSQVSCERCRMVSYCSRNHREVDRVRHGDLCAGLANINSKILSRVGELSAEEYRVFRWRSVEFLENEAGRPLEPWEREIVLYPRVCRVCRESSAEKLRLCQVCSMEYFCENDASVHDRWCREFRVFRNCLTARRDRADSGDREDRGNRRGRSPKVPNVHPNMAAGLQRSNFDEIVLGIYGDTRQYREMDCVAYSNLSQSWTIPLTALYAAQIALPFWREKTDWRIDVLGAEIWFEGRQPAVWEKVFLHLLPGARSVEARLVGPELRLPSGLPTDLLSPIPVCSSCESSGRTVRFTLRPETLYHELERDSFEPDLVCLFNPGLYRRTGFDGRDTWPETIQRFCETGVPVLVTSYTEEEIPREIERIRSLCEIEVLLEPRRNPFASVKPDRNFVSDDVAPLIYKNYCLAVVRGKGTFIP